MQWATDLKLHYVIADPKIGVKLHYVIADPKIGE